MRDHIEHVPKARASANKISKPLTINNTTFAKGTRTTVELPAGRLYTHTPVTIPVHVLRGKSLGHACLSARLYTVMKLMVLKLFVGF